jgi:hypothetical protein
MQFVMQSIQQAYLETRERAVIVLEGWDTADAVLAHKRRYNHGGIDQTPYSAVDREGFVTARTAPPTL